MTTKEILSKGWNQLNKDLMLFSEEDLKKLIEAERKSQARLRVMVRLYHRYSKLRGIREKAELAGCARG
jgi:hypothetical protein